MCRFGGGLGGTGSLTQNKNQRRDKGLLEKILGNIIWSIRKLSKIVVIIY